MTKNNHPTGPFGQFAIVSTPIPAVILAALLFTTLFVAVEKRYPMYLQSGAESTSPDARQYMRLARNIAARGVYSRAASGEGEPDMMRPPLYPLFLVALGTQRPPWLIYLAQGILLTATTVFVYQIAARAGGPWAGLIASLLCASDLMLVTICFQALTEIAFLFTTVFALWVLRWPTLEGSTPSNRQLVAAGLLVGCSTLIRPTNLYLPVALALSYWIGSWYVRRRSAFRIRRAALLLGSFALVVAPWIVRNHLVLGVTKLSTIDTHNLVYYVGASGYQRHFGWDQKKAQLAIQEEFDLPSYSELQNPWTAEGKTVRQMHADVKRAVPHVLSKYPKDLLESLVIGIGRATLAHVNIDLAHLTKSNWVSIRAPQENSKWLYGALAWQLGHTCIVLALSVCGLVAMVWKPKTRVALLLMVAVAAYYYLTIAVFGTDAGFRARVAVMPVLCVLAGVGFAAIAGIKKRAEHGSDPGCGGQVDQSGQRPG